MPTHDSSGKTDAEKYIDSLNRELKPGDVAYDKNSGSWVYVVGIAADSVEAYDAREGGRDLLTYAGNQLTACTMQDTVVSAVHLNKNTTKSSGSGSVYDFPAGRLVRFVPETADDDLHRVQSTLRLEVVSDLLAAMKNADADKDDPVQQAAAAVRQVWGEAARHEALELSQVKAVARDGDDSD